MAKSKQHRDQQHQAVEFLLQLLGTQAEEMFLDIAPVRRVALKLNPFVVGQFIAMATLTNGQRFEALVQAQERQVRWCREPNCNCMGFARTSSPLEAGLTIEE